MSHNSPIAPTNPNWILSTPFGVRLRFKLVKSLIREIKEELEEIKEMEEKIESHL